MNMENLLKPRYLVIEGYPDSDFEVGMIITFGGKSSAYTGTEEWETVPIKGKNGGTSMRCIKYFEPFPAIFRPLHWWEFRDESEMPEYVKNSDTVIKIIPSTLDDGRVYMADASPDGMRHIINLKNLLPATEQQYLTYINSKNGK